MYLLKTIKTNSTCVIACLLGLLCSQAPRSLVPHPWNRSAHCSLPSLQWSLYVQDKNNKKKNMLNWWGWGGWVGALPLLWGKKKKKVQKGMLWTHILFLVQCNNWMDFKVFYINRFTLRRSKRNTRQTIQTIKVKYHFREGALVEGSFVENNPCFTYGKKNAIKPKSNQ